jgi:hypothetical protein
MSDLGIETLLPLTRSERTVIGLLYSTYRIDFDMSSIVSRQLYLYPFRICKAPEKTCYCA